MSKYKGKNNTSGTPEVYSARNKLDGVLKTLVDKKDDSPIKEQGIKEEADSFSDTLPVTPPRKQVVSRQSRKRKRSRDELSSSDLTQYHHTYVKLFDRSVDLAQFDENSALYPICRAWIQPHNHSLVLDETHKTELSDDEDDELHTIYKLASPVAMKREDGIEGDLRVPSPVPQPDEHLDINADPFTAPNSQQLLDTHMGRWKATRQRWKEAARKNEARYAESLTMLKDMFDRQCKDQ